MPDKQVYEYALIRFVPRVEREEFLNVGVILFCKRKKYLQVKYHIDQKRLSALGEDIDLLQLETYLQSWDWISQGKKEGGLIACLDLPSRFRWLTATRSTIIQSSKVHPGMTDDPQAVLDRLFENYVL
ncbi:MAG: DUF3037 domain-containing protein [Bacteroidota bacterium]